MINVLLMLIFPSFFASNHNYGIQLVACYTPFAAICLHGQKARFTLYHNGGGAQWVYSLIGVRGLKSQPMSHLIFITPRLPWIKDLLDICNRDYRSFRYTVMYIHCRCVLARNKGCKI